MGDEADVRERLARIETTLVSINTKLATLDYVPRPEIMLMRAETAQRLMSLERSRDRLQGHITTSWLAILGVIAYAAWGKLFS